MILQYSTCAVLLKTVKFLKYYKTNNKILAVFYVPWEQVKTDTRKLILLLTNAGTHQS